MIHRYAGEQRIVAGWEDKYRIPVFTSGMNQIRAMKALGAKRIVGAGYDSITGPIVEQYFRDAGFDVIAIEKVKATWEEVGLLTNEPDDRDDGRTSSAVIPGGQVMYLQGSKWPSLDVVEELEHEIGVPVVQAVAARCWEIQLRLGLRQSGFRLRQARCRDAEWMREDACLAFGSEMRWWSRARRRASAAPSRSSWRGAARSSRSGTCWRTG